MKTSTRPHPEIEDEYQIKKHTFMYLFTNDQSKRQEYIFAYRHISTAAILPHCGDSTIQTCVDREGSDGRSIPMQAQVFSDSYTVTWGCGRLSISCLARKWFGISGKKEEPHC